MSATKQKIIRAAAELFHTFGVAPVRLQQIADQAEVSVGNLAYHFKNKETIVQAVYEELSQEVKEILLIFRRSPTLIDLDNQLSQWFVFQQSYSFYFLADLPGAVAPLRKQVLNRLTVQLQKRFEYHIQRGVIQPTHDDRNYSAVTEVISLVITHWSSYQALCREADDERQFKRLVWTQLLPYFTPRGQAEYQTLIYPIVTPSS